MFVTDVSIAFFTGVLFILVPLALRERFDYARPGDERYRALHSLLQPAELTFYLALCRALGDHYVVLPKIALAAFVRPSRGLPAGARKLAQSMLQQEHADFVVCRADTLALWCVIELDEELPAHAWRAHALDSAQIPVVAFASRLSYDPAEVRQRIHDSLKNAWRREQMELEEHPLPLSSVV